MMNLTLHKLGQKLFSRAKIDVLLVLKKHFESIQEIQLETCLNGTIYCLMSVPLMKDRARKMGLREFLGDRFRQSDNQQVKTQIDHIFDKMDEEDEDIWQNNRGHKRGAHAEQHFVIDEEEAELDDDNNVDGLKKEKEEKKHKDEVVPEVTIEEEDMISDDGEGGVDEIEDEEDDEDEEEDEKMSISDFSIDEDFFQYQFKNQVAGSVDPWAYFEGRMLERTQKKQAK